MQLPHPTVGSRGFTFVELLVTAAVTVLVFGGIMASVQFAVKLISIAKAKTGAVSLANERLEYIRSLEYMDIGTIAGIPPGPIPQTSTTTLNGITYFERVLIQYVDGIEDGYGAADTNGILADYKRAKVEYSWLGQSGTSSIFLQTDIAPPGIESTAGGGTLVVNVFDASVQPVSGASVRVRNNTTTSTIDTTQLTNAQGVAIFAGAPAAAQYEIAVTRAGFSTDGTYQATTSNPDPTTPPIAVLEGAVSTMNFQIDRLSTLLVRTVEPAVIDTVADTFSDASQIGVLSDALVSGGAVVLAGGAGSYVPLGSVLATSTTPAVIAEWGTASWNATTGSDTEILVRVYSVTSGTYTLVPDSDLPGNSTGFSSGSIVLAGLDPATYETLALGAELRSTDSNETPELLDWQITYIVNEPPINDVDFTLESSRVIGTTPIFKYQVNHTTDSDGEAVISNLEWGAYKVFVLDPSYDVQEACPALPVPVNPGVSEELSLTLVPNAPRSVRVSVVNTLGNPVLGASVEVSRSGFSDTEITTSCGQAFFNSGLASAVDYTISVSAAGYTAQSLSDFTIDDDESVTITLAP